MEDVDDSYACYDIAVDYMVDRHTIVWGDAICHHPTLWDEPKSDAGIFTSDSVE